MLGIVLEHRGVIEFSSEPDQGTTFRVHLPVTEDEPTRDSDDDIAAIETGNRSGTILLAEDDAQVRVVTEWILHQQGYKVLAASSGVEALELLSLIHISGPRDRG